MNRVTTLEYTSLPWATPAYVKALMPRRRGIENGIPRIEAHLRGLQPDASRLTRYRSVCNFPASDHLPVSYPHVLAFPLHLQVLTHRAFPLGLMGLVHVRNTIRQKRAIGAGEELDLTVYVEGHQDVSNGIEFDLMTRVHTAGDEQAVWESTSTMLARSRVKTDKKEKRQRERRQSVPETGQSVSWPVVAGIGRRYARVAGDINPIHLSAVSARLFGFPRAIAHGMWLLARCVAELDGRLPNGPLTYDVAFKLPVLLPGRVVLRYNTDSGRIHLALLSSAGEKPHLVGTIDGAA